MGGEPDYAVVAVLKVRLDLLRLGGGGGVFLLLLAALLVFLQQLVQFLLFLAAAEIGIGLAVEEHNVDVLLGAPAAVAAVSVLVRFPGHRLAFHRPAETAVGVAAAGEVHGFAAFHLDHGDIAVVPTSIGHPGAKDVAAVGAPGKGLVSVGIGIVHALVKRFFLAGLEVHYHQFGAVAQVGDVFSVGRYLHLEAGLALRRYALFLEAGGVSEQLVVLVLQGCAPDAPFAVTLGGVVQAAAVLGETHSALLAGRVGDAARGLEVDGGHEHLAPYHYRNLLSSGRNGHRCGAGSEVQAEHLAVAVVPVQGDIDLPGLLAVLHCVEVAVVGEGYGAVVRYREEAHGILVEMGELDALFGGRNRAPVHVEGLSVLLAQVVERIAVGSENRVAVLALVGGELLEAALCVDDKLRTGLGGCVQPDVARYRRCVVLAQGILVALVVLVEEGTVGLDGDVHHWQAGDDGGSAAVEGYLI